MTLVQRRWMPVLALCGGLALGLSGCGWSESGPPRHDVQGHVSYAGQQVPRGLIRFTPDHSKGNSGPGAVADIHDGFFQTKSGRGVISGPHVVLISGFDGVAQPDSALPEGASLFSPYTTTWSFEDKTAVVDIEVPAKKARN